MPRLRLFALLREAAGTDRDEIEAGDVRDLLQVARQRYGQDFARALEFASIAVNQTDIRSLNGMDTRLEPDDEVALLPPVSGGARRNEIALG